MGEEPSQARFRATFGDAVKFVVVDYPSLRETIKSFGRFDSIVDAVVAQIITERAAGPYLLAGYSFGGFVAREAARRLVECGQDVTFLGLIDARLELRFSKQRVHAKAIRFIGKLCSQPKLGMFRARVWILERLPLTITTLLNRLQTILPIGLAALLELELVTRLRMKSLYETTIKPLSIKTTLFQSEEQFGEKPDYDWDMVSENLVMISIGGSHLSLFDPPNCHILRDRMLEAVNSAYYTDTLTEIDD